MTTKEKYNILKAKYNLPDYDELNRDFMIEEIHDDFEIILPIVRVKIHEKMEYYAEIMASVVQPDTILKDMYEAKYISDNFRADAYVVFKRLMRLIRYSESISITNSDPENAEYIKESFSEWKNLGKEVSKHILKLKSLWEKETDIKEDLSYFG